MDIEFINCNKKAKDWLVINIECQLNNIFNVEMLKQVKKLPEVYNA